VSGIIKLPAHHMYFQKNNPKIIEVVTNAQEQRYLMYKAYIQDKNMNLERYSQYGLWDSFGFNIMLKIMCT
jgi:hypothetical protein